MGTVDKGAGDGRDHQRTPPNAWGTIGETRAILLNVRGARFSVRQVGWWRRAFFRRHPDALFRIESGREGSRTTLLRGRVGSARFQLVEVGPIFGGGRTPRQT